MKEKNIQVDINTLVEATIGENLKKEMEIGIRGIYSVIQKYSAVLHEGDILKTQKMVRDAFFHPDKPIISDDNVQMDMKVVVDSVSEDTKQKLYELIQKQIASQFNITSLSNEN
ncbi:hypothetical protein [Bacillus subtilis]|uniref:hypothetical protein n=1 Tax=Bacillus subtilis TaxID=1423 RepID=UPI001B94527F|nr:hypothetical protein [Bacillus subtilis]CAI6330677.1 hypothetical protein NRS6096_21945 [Bacillus subtilis]